MRYIKLFEDYTKLNEAEIVKPEIDHEQFANVENKIREMYELLGLHPAN